MKIHSKKKAYRKMLRDLAKDGHINLADGRMAKRGQAVDNSMKRDYSPQGA